jgi:hypothetical protein
MVDEDGERVTLAVRLSPGTKLLVHDAFYLMAEGIG